MGKLLNKDLKNNLNLNEKFKLKFSKKLFNTKELKILNDFFGLANYSQVLKKCIEFIAFNQVELEKELLSQISYNDNNIKLINKIRNTSKELEYDISNKDNDSYVVNIQLWKLLFSLESLKKENIYELNDFIGKIVQKNVEAYYKLFPEKGEKNERSV